MAGNKTLPNPSLASGDGSKLQPPPDWPMLVSSQEPAAALAFAVGNFPQLVRHVQPLLHAKNLSELRPSAGRSIPTPALLTWAAQVSKKKQYPEMLLALGALRLARQFDKAEEILAKQRGHVPQQWQEALSNEEAALAWHSGKGEEALKMWQKQPESMPVLFNRGMALLFLGKAADARTALTAAIAKLPEDSAWHHLAHLYLALAEKGE